MSSEEEDQYGGEAEYSDDDSYGPGHESFLSHGGRESKQYRNTRRLQALSKPQEGEEFGKVEDNIIAEINRDAELDDEIKKKTMNNLAEELGVENSEPALLPQETQPQPQGPSETIAVEDQHQSDADSNRKSEKGQKNNEEESGREAGRSESKGDQARNSESQEPPRDRPSEQSPSHEPTNLREEIGEGETGEDQHQAADGENGGKQQQGRGSVKEEQSQQGKNQMKKDNESDQEERQGNENAERTEKEQEQHEHQPEPAQEEVELAHEQPEPAQEEVELAHEQREPAHEQPQLAQQQPEPAHEQPQPAHEQPQLAQQQPEPAQQQPQPAHEEVELAQEQPEPAHEDVKSAHQEKAEVDHQQESQIEQIPEIETSKIQHLFASPHKQQEQLIPTNEKLADHLVQIEASAIPDNSGVYSYISQATDYHVIEPEEQRHPETTQQDDNRIRLNEMEVPEGVWTKVESSEHFVDEESAPPVQHSIAQVETGVQQGEMENEAMPAVQVTALESAGQEEVSESEPIASPVPEVVAQAHVNFQQKIEEKQDSTSQHQQAESVVADLQLEKKQQAGAPISSQEIEPEQSPAPYEEENVEKAESDENAPIQDFPTEANAKTEESVYNVTSLSNVAIVREPAQKKQQELSSIQPSHEDEMPISKPTAYEVSEQPLSHSFKQRAEPEDEKIDIDTVNAYTAKTDQDNGKNSKEEMQSEVKLLNKNEKALEEIEDIDESLISRRILQASIQEKPEKGREQDPGNGSETCKCRLM